MKKIVWAVILLVILYFLQDYFRFSAFAGIISIAFLAAFIYLIVAITQAVRNSVSVNKKEKVTELQTPKKSTGSVWLFAIVVIVVLIIILKETIGKYSFEALLFVDNLVKFTNDFPPLIAWGLLGLLVGAIYGSFVAWKKYKLNFTINLIPIGVFVACIVLFFLVNNPTQSKPIAAAHPVQSENAYNLVAVTDNNPVDTKSPYKISYLLDNNDKTAWIIDLDKQRTNQQIQFTFNGIDNYANKHLQCVGFTIKNGYRKSAQLWTNFARVKELSIKHNETFVSSATAYDSNTNDQQIRFSPVSIRPNDQFTVTINSVYLGKKYARRVGITELVPIVEYENF